MLLPPSVWRALELAERGTPEADIPRELKEEGVWHGYPVGWMEVPAKLRNKWKQAGKVNKKDMHKNWEGHG